MPNEQTEELNLPNEEIILEETVEEEPKEAPKKEYTVEQKLARINRMKTKLEKELGIEPKPEPKKTSELDNGDYAYLATKGIDEDDPRIDFIKEKMAKWGLPLRELMKDEDIQSKLKSLKIERDVRVATPSSTKRSAGTTSDNEDYFYQKYMQTGVLPEVMPKGMAERLVDRRYQESDPRQNPFE
mgnify:CR=1 FL=1